MSLSTVLQQNDSGITFLITIVQQDGKTAQDISNASSLTMCITRSDGSVIHGGSFFVTNGQDGQMFYISGPTDLGVVGIYKIRGQWSVGANTFYTNKALFLVEPNFC